MSFSYYQKSDKNFVVWRDCNYCNYWERLISYNSGGWYLSGGEDFCHMEKFISARGDLVCIEAAPRAEAWEEVLVPYSKSKIWNELI